MSHGIKFLEPKRRNQGYGSKALRSKGGPDHVKK